MLRPCCPGGVAADSGESRRELLPCVTRKPSREKEPIVPMSVVITDIMHNGKPPSGSLTRAAAGALLMRHDFSLLTFSCYFFVTHRRGKE